ncbi:hypothetical protein WGH24286_00151 [Periweissella ghanensis]|uniref:Uncharacterized protein n=1 Tax=Periweissella ghanensis TaxID=467997 RepID=A0ABN8BNH1_9LACO|nr:hypothetical protein WGH24286_00151 [Periweissella ghanensis]
MMVASSNGFGLIYITRSYLGWAAETPTLAHKY